MDLKEFQHHGASFRPAPFWAINDRVSPEEIARQIEAMIDTGMSGAFFHSRSGIITDYLGDEWFAAVGAALKAAKRKGGYLWLYDEDVWPSGNAGGKVAATKEEYRQASLNAILVAAGEDSPALTPDQSLRYCYAIKARDGLMLRDWQSVPLHEVDSVREHERLFLVRAYAPKTNWWGGESYSNLLDPEVTRLFIQLTHEQYFKRFGEDFGNAMPGIFTDEAALCFTPTGFAWYEGLPDLYQEWTGRKWQSDLPYLFFDGPEAARIRLLVHRTIQRQFIEAYTRPLYEWCEEHGIALTGHFASEENFATQILSNYGGIMAHYRYMQIPGIDHICRNIHGPHGWGSDTGLLFTCKQVASAARQLGRKQVLTEIFGGTRHTNTFEDFKWLGDYDLVLGGTNFFCPHLAWYSARGRRKRDFPPNMNYQQTYWQDLPSLYQYFTRIGYALDCGKALCDIVMLHAVETASSRHRFGTETRGAVTCNPVEDLTPAYEYNRLMTKSLEAILSAGYECDLGDEGYIEDLGNVSGDNFIIGEMSYKVVVIPPSITWRPRTFELLRQFAANGGRLLFIGQLPTELDCEDAREKWMDLAASLPAGRNPISVPSEAQSIRDAIDEITPRTFMLKGVDGCALPRTYVQHRRDGDEEIFFVVNSDRELGRDCVLMLLGAAGKQITLWNAVDGTCGTVSAIEVGTDLRYTFSLPPSGSVLLTLGKAPKSVSHHDTGQKNLSHSRVTRLGPEFDFTRSEENVLVLDRISVSFDGGQSFEDEDLEFRIRKRIATRFETSTALEWQPWVAVKKGIFDGKGGEIVLRYRFLSDLEKPTTYAVIEDLVKGALSVNGAPVDVSSCSWHWDRSFGKIEISDHVQKGENTIDFKVTYDFLTEVESAYLVGDFGVEMIDPFRGKIVAEPERLMSGSLSHQGYPFYCGRMIYRTIIEPVSTSPNVSTQKKRTFLRLVRPSGILYKVRVNGESAGRILWRPFEIDLTRFLGEGPNLLEIEVVTSMQNVWGPLHERVGDDSTWTGPNAFEEEPFLREEINSFNYGLLGGAELISED